MKEGNKDEEERGKESRRKRRKQLRKEKLKRQQRSEKANEKARKAAEKAAEREIRSSKNTVFCLASKKCKTSLESCQSALGSTTAVTSSAAASVTIKGRKFSDWQCCTCYRSFADDEREETGLEWVECKCTRWLHEEWSDYDIEFHADGRELLCPYCVLNHAKNVIFLTFLMIKTLRGLSCGIFGGIVSCS